MATPDLVLFTASFPYDDSESVLNSELAVTAHRFDRIFVVPSRAGRQAGRLPANATVVDLPWAEGWPRSAKLAVLRSRLAAKIISESLRYVANWPAYSGRARTYLDILATSLLKARTISSWIATERLHDALFYDYWFENSTLAIAALRTSGKISCAVARAHRFDIFDSSWGRHGRVPYREFKARNLDKVFAVSANGADYLRPRFRGDARKLAVSRLGLPVPPSYPSTPTGLALVISCSGMFPRKQVHLIPDVLAACDRELHWIHFGDGPERERVERAAARLPPRVTWELRGRVANATVHQFYTDHRVTAFLSLSLSEGIPISMMEAQSVGTPIIALSVGGIPELVTPQTGTLLPADASIPTIAQALTAVLSGDRFDPADIRSIFATRYDATTTYREFADSLIALWSYRTGHS